ncbi:hypothetical protein MKEN_01344500 [Mycena kentingensis (nom. inval.)]|nr:hypothetical protein MKEN_01344500 [Mycena kentingensis (nom. inval.)]
MLAQDNIPFLISPHLKIIPRLFTKLPLRSSVVSSAPTCKLAVLPAWIDDCVHHKLGADDGILRKLTRKTGSSNFVLRALVAITQMAPTLEEKHA